MHQRLLLLTLPLAVLSYLAHAQAVGVGTSTPDASALLDIRGTTKGLLIPRVALGSLTDAATVASPAPSLLVYNTNTALSGGVGYYFNAGTSTAPQWQRLVTQASLDATDANVASLGTTSWRTTGNSLAATSQLGSTSNQHIDLLTNNLVRGRLSNRGELFWGTTSTVTTGDMVDYVANTTFPWALNGYSSFNGSGVFGSIRGSNTTVYAAVQGEYNGTGAFNAAGIRGIYYGTVAGTALRSQASAGPVAAMVGSMNSSLNYSYGVYGNTPGTSSRSAGVYASSGSNAQGALGYQASTNLSYSVYGFSGAYETGGAGGRPAAGSAAAPASTHIGLGLEGGVMGGWIRGQVYGLHALGERYSLYVDGPAVVNQPLTQLAARPDGSRVATYAPSATTADVYARGRAELRDGAAFVAFPADFAALLSNPQEATITVTPTGETRGVYVERVTETGFYVRENQPGRSQAPLNWTATGLRRGFEQTQPAPELLSADFDPRMRRVMQSDARPEATPQPLWWDGQQLRYDQPPAPKRDPNYFSGARPQSDVPARP